MPIHDWTRVEAGIFHHFHHEWISTLSHALNRGILPPDHYALAEQLAGGDGPDVLTLEGPAQAGNGGPDEGRGGVALAAAPPKLSFHARTQAHLPQMPLFLTLDSYVTVPLETTYQAAWEAVPSVWQKILERSR